MKKLKTIVLTILFTFSSPMLMKGDIMRFKKIVFGLILSLLLAFPAYASEIIPISVDNAGVNSIIQPRGSHR